MYFFLLNYITNFFEKRTITLPNAISNFIDFNYYSITQKALNISDLFISFTLQIFQFEVFTNYHPSPIDSAKSDIDLTDIDLTLSLILI